MTAQAATKEPIGVRGRPFTRGKSGNPLGGRYVGKRYLELHAAVLADFREGELTGLERALIDQAVHLLAKAERAANAEVAARAASVAARLLARIQRPAKLAEGPSLADVLAAEPQDDEGQP